MERTGTEPKARKMIGLNFQTKSFLKTSVFGVHTRVLHNTLVNKTNEYMGSQSVLYNATVALILSEGSPLISEFEELRPIAI